MSKLKFFILLFALLMIGCSYAVEPTEEAKKKITRSLYRSHKTKIDDLSTAYSMHPMYVVLHLVETESIQADSWVVGFLLNTAGHWGWSQEKKANALETAVYREAAICMFWEQPTARVEASAPQFLSVVKRDSEKWSTLLPELVFSHVANTRRQLLVIAELSYIKDQATGEWYYTREGAQKDDQRIVEAYLDLGYSIFKAQEAKIDPKQLNLPFSGSIQVFTHYQVWMLRNRFIPDFNSKVQNGEWFGIFRVNNSWEVAHEPTMAFRTLNMRCGQSFRLNGGCRYNGFVTTADINLSVGMSPLDYYRELQKFGDVVVREPEALRLYLMGK